MMTEGKTPGETRRPDQFESVTGVTLTYIGQGALVTRGPRSRRTYQVFAPGDLVFVHPDDVESLLRLRVFTHPRAVMTQGEWG